ncbi:IS110 family transposase [Nesterenkonia sp. LB17]|uniref:IS110 family transposase n=1 Tax=Nesterenkonia sp. LB17 TaxID=2901230 RepID=UPI001F4CD59A|nr:IS110 family transposase [Nesterenkonia sp. LB17]MCH8564622.1 IS110 family transposase [Nesterenkonia sp. LB17]
MTVPSLVTQEVVIAGIDAHQDTHHVAVLTHTGALLGDQQFPASPPGYRALLDWVAAFGLIDRIGVESTGSYAAGLTRFLTAEGIDVREVNMPHAHTKARRGKSDAIDDEAAARKTLAGDATAVPKTTTGLIKSIRHLTLARHSAVKARSSALVQLQALLITAPDPVRERITASSGAGKAVQCLRLRADVGRLGEPLHAAKLALRMLAVRIRGFDEEIATLDAHLAHMVADAAPTLLTRVGISTGHAAQLLITAGENIDRLHSEAAFARLCGVAPIPVSSGKSHRMRLHRGGDRQANRALHMIAVCRLRYDPRTRAYMQRRQTDGLSKKDILRCLKRYIAREVYNDLKTDLGVP